MSVTRLKANGDKFTLYAVCNSRGDVEELRKEDGTIYARYVYDSWGNVLHIYSGTGTTEITSTANLALQNPFRYRGYYFDTESGLYYLQSRYYDPVTGRFVNADDESLEATRIIAFFQKFVDVDKLYSSKANVFASSRRVVFTEEEQMTLWVFGLLQRYGLDTNVYL